MTSAVVACFAVVLGEVCSAKAQRKALRQVKVVAVDHA